MEERLAYIGIYTGPEKTLVAMLGAKTLGGNPNRVMYTNGSTKLEGDELSIITEWEYCKEGGGWKSYRHIHKIPAVPVVTIEHMPQNDAELMVATEAVPIHNDSQLIW